MANTYTFPPFATANLSTGTFYAHLVTTVPSTNNTLVSDLVLPSVSGYVPVILTGVSLTASRWTASNITFPIYNFTTPVVGVVIAKQSGGSPAPSDSILAYSDLTNSLSQSINSGTGSVNLFIEISTNGFVSYTDNYIYASGDNPNDEPIPKGLIYMLGTNNNTTSYTNPLTSAKIISIHEAGSNTNGFDRSLVSPSTVRQYYIFDFTKFTVKVADFYVYSMSNTANISLWGANSSSAYNTGVISDSGWTQLNTPVPLVANQWTNLASTNTSYWKYLRLKSNSADISLQEIELYNSFILSPSQNMV